MASNLLSLARRLSSGHEVLVAGWQPTSFCDDQNRRKPTQDDQQPPNIYQRKTLLVTLLKDKVAIRSAPHTSCEVHAFLGDA